MQPAVAHQAGGQVELPGLCDGQHQAEDHDGGAIVEQAFAFQHDLQPPGHANGAEQRHHGNRVGGGDQGTEDERRRQRQACAGADVMLVVGSSPRS